MKRYITSDDFKDILIKGMHRGWSFVFSKIHFSWKRRTVTVFDNSREHNSNFWDIPYVKKRWNSLLSRNNMRLTKNIEIRDSEPGIQPYVLSIEVDDLTIKNVGENDATFELLIKNKKLEIDQTLVYLIHSGIAQKLHF